MRRYSRRRSGEPLRRPGQERARRRRANDLRTSNHRTVARHARHPGCRQHERPRIVPRETRRRASSPTASQAVGRSAEFTPRLRKPGAMRCSSSPATCHTSTATFVTYLLDLHAMPTPSCPYSLRASPVRHRTVTTGLVIIPCARRTRAPAWTPIARRLADRRLKMTDLLADVRTRFVTAEEIERFGDGRRLLANVNTPAEYAGFQGHKL